LPRFRLARSFLSCFSLFDVRILASLNQQQEKLHEKIADNHSYDVCSFDFHRGRRDPVWRSIASASGNDANNECDIARRYTVRFRGTDIRRSTIGLADGAWLGSWIGR
jgi:hypothetical protein